MKMFTSHPGSVGESYLQHLRHATGFGVHMVVGGLACLVHGLFPFWFVSTGSRQIAALHDRMVINRSNKKAEEQADLAP